MNFRASLRWVAFLLMAWSTGHASTLLDGAFASWTFDDTGTSTATATLSGSGGNPGAFLSLSLTQDASGNLARLTALSSLAYAPGSSGEIGSLTLQMDLQRSSLAQQAFGLLLQQGAGVFSSGTTFTNSNAGWTSFTSTALTGADFHLVSGSGVLDLSAAGGPITFGFFAANSGTPNLTTGSGVDNFTVSVAAIPEPANSAAATGLALLAVAAWRLHRRSSKFTAGR